MQHLKQIPVQSQKRWLIILLFYPNAQPQQSRLRSDVVFINDLYAVVFHEKDRIRLDNSSILKSQANAAEKALVFGAEVLSTELLLIPHEV